MLLSNALAGLLLLSSCLSAKTTFEEKQSNHIFNAVHSSMRQWGSSIHHNGMSFFIAKVPPNTHFYHGTNQDKPIKGFEWLAFEPEHGMFFARMFSWPGGPRLQPHDFPSPPIHLGRQRVFQDEHRQPTDNTTRGYFHTYKTRHQLRLLYLDGMSAAKSDGGTLDTQDHLLAYDLNLRNGSPFKERERAAFLCQRAKKDWHDRIDGFLRMEGGFEIILCSFEKHLDIVRITAVEPPPKSIRNDIAGVSIPITDQHLMSYYQAISARYRGIEGGRVSIDYDHFVTSFTFDEDLFACGNSSMPRLKGISKKTRKSIEDAVTRMIMSSRSRKRPSGTAWQSVTDMIVSRHAPRLAYLTSPAISNEADMVSLLEETLGPFIDYYHRDAKEEIDRCTYEYLPSQWSSTVAGRAAYGVSSKICSTLFRLLHQQYEETNLDLALHTITELKDWLDWAVWRECKTCLVDEVCVVPVWPFGGKDDWKHPSCANVTTLRHHIGYWQIEAPPHKRPSEYH